MLRKCRQLSAGLFLNVFAGSLPGAAVARAIISRMSTDLRHPLHRPRLPVGLLGEPGAGGAALALRRAARLAARDDRAGRGSRSATSSRLHADAHGRSASSSFRRYGMPFALEPRARVAATARACRAIVATRLLDPAREDEVLRALQFGWFTTHAAARRGRGHRAARSRRSTGSTSRRSSPRSTTPQTIAAYEADKRETRTAEGGPTDFQGKARQTDGPVRYSAPSLVFESDGRPAPGGGRLPDDRGLRRADRQPRPHARAPGPAGGPAGGAERFPAGLVTPGGRGDHGAEQPAARPRRGRARADRARRRRRGARARRSATTRSGSRPELAAAPPC